MDSLHFSLFSVICALMTVHADQAQRELTSYGRLTSSCWSNLFARGSQSGKCFLKWEELNLGATHFWWVFQIYFLRVLCSTTKVTSGRAAFRETYLTEEKLFDPFLTSSYTFFFFFKSQGIPRLLPVFLRVVLCLLSVLPLLFWPVWQH